MEKSRQIKGVKVKVSEKDQGEEAGRRIFRDNRPGIGVSEREKERSKNDLPLRDLPAREKMSETRPL